MQSSPEKHSGWLLIIGIIVGVLAITAGPAFAALTFSGTGITGDSSGVVIDSSSTISIGTSTATGINIGNGSSTVDISGSPVTPFDGLYVGPDESTLPSEIQGYITPASSGVVGLTDASHQTAFAVEAASNGAHNATGIYSVVWSGYNANAIEGDSYETNANATGFGSVGVLGYSSAEGDMTPGDNAPTIGLEGSANAGSYHTATGATLIGLQIDQPGLGDSSTAVAAYGIFIEDQTGATDNYAIYTGLGKVRFGDVVQIATSTFSALPTCNPAEEGTQHPVTDSTTSTIGATISAGGGSSHVLAYCDGTNWTVMAK
jgi:hypothetical protein